MIISFRVQAATKTYRKTLLISAALAAVATPAVALAQQATSAQTGAVRIAIPAQSLDSALTALADQAGLRILFSSSDVAQIQSSGLNGIFSPSEALSRLLTGSGFTFRFVGTNSVTLERAPTAAGNVVQLGPVRVEASTSNGSADLSVTSDPIATEGAKSYAARGVSMFKGTQTLRETPQSTTVITRKLLDDLNLTTIEQVMEKTPGITVYDSPMGGKYFYSRGFMLTGGAGAYLYDGVPLDIGGDYVQANSFSADMAYLDRVEVLRGTGGMLRGVGNPAGSVNFVRKRGLKETGVTAAFQAGSWNNYRGQIDAGGPLNASGTLRGRVVLGLQDREYFYDVSRRADRVGYAALDYDLGPNTTVGVGIAYENLDSVPCFHGLPSYSDGSDMHLSRSTCLGMNWNRWKSERVTAFGDVTHRLNEDWTLKVAAAYSRNTQAVKYAFSEGNTAPGATATSLSIYSGLFHYDHRDYGIDAYLDGGFEALGQRQKIIVGLNASNSDRDDRWALIRMSGTQNAFAPTHTIAEPDDAYYYANAYRGGATPDTTVNKNFSLYANLRLKPAEPVAVVLGGRLSWFDFEHEDWAYYGEHAYQRIKDNAKFTPFAALIYDLTGHLSVYASYAESFKPQNNYETATGERLKPTTGASYEAGIKGDWLDGHLTGAVNLYRTNRRDLAQTDYETLCPRSSDGYCYVNSGRVRAQGFEAELSGELFRGFQIFGGYTYTDTKVLNDVTATTSGTVFNTYVPRHLLRLWANYDVGPFSIGGGVAAQSKNYNLVRTVRVEQPGYSVWNTRLGYRVNEHWDIALNVENPFDKRYYQTIGSTSFNHFYGQPRSFMATLRFRN